MRMRMRIKNICKILTLLSLGSLTNARAINKREEMPNDPNLQLMIISPVAGASKVPEWSRQKSNTIKFYSWLNNTNIDMPKYDISSVKVVASRTDSKGDDVMLCSEVPIKNGEMKCKINRGALDAAQWTVKITPCDDGKLGWNLATFPLTIVPSDEEKFTEYIIPPTTHYVGNGIPCYITSPIKKANSEVLPSYILNPEKKIGDIIQIEYRTFDGVFDNYPQLKDVQNDIKVNVQMAYLPASHPNEVTTSQLQAVSWMNACENLSINKETGKGETCQVDLLNSYAPFLKRNGKVYLNNGINWIRLVEADTNKVIGQTFFTVKNSLEDLNLPTNNRQMKNGNVLDEGEDSADESQTQPLKDTEVESDDETSTKPVSDSSVGNSDKDKTSAKPIADTGIESEDETSIKPITDTGIDSEDETSTKPIADSSSSSSQKDNTSTKPVTDSSSSSSQKDETSTKPVADSSSSSSQKDETFTKPVTDTGIDSEDETSVKSECNCDNENSTILAQLTYPVIQKTDNAAVSKYEKWIPTNTQEKHEIHWTTIVNNDADGENNNEVVIANLNVDVYLVYQVINEKSRITNKICSEVPLSNHYCTFKITDVKRYPYGTWNVVIKNSENSKKLCSNGFVEFVKNISSNEKNNEQSNKKTNSNKATQVKYISTSLRSPYEINLGNVPARWDDSKGYKITWIAKSSNIFNHDNPTLSVVAQQGKQYNITLCENVDISSESCDVPANSFPEDGDWLLAWMKDKLILAEAKVSVSDSLNLDEEEAKAYQNTNTSNVKSNLMLMESIMTNKEDEIDLYTTYNSIGDDGYPEYKKYSNQKITGKHMDLVNQLMISEASDINNTSYPIVCLYKDDDECVFELPDEINGREGDSHWVLEAINKKNIVISRIPVRLVNKE